MASRYTTLNRRGKRLRQPTDELEKEEGRERKGHRHQAVHYHGDHRRTCAQEVAGGEFSSPQSPIHAPTHMSWYPGDRLLSVTASNKRYEAGG